MPCFISMRSIAFSNLPFFSRSFFLRDMIDFLQKVSLKTCKTNLNYEQTLTNVIPRITLTFIGKDDFKSSELSGHQTFPTVKLYIH